LFTYLSPLILVMTLTLAKEAYDDFKRYRRDKESNSTKYRLIRHGQLHTIQSQDIQVGDLIEIHAKERIPSDVVIVATSEPTGSIFIKTDQLDGETDWKVRRAVRTTHAILANDRFARIN
jgi:phospholipid-translocating ATPase